MRVLKTMKSNYGPAGGEIRVRWRDGVFIMSDGSAEGSAFEHHADHVFRASIHLVQIFDEEDNWNALA